MGTEERQVLFCSNMTKIIIETDDARELTLTGGKLVFRPEAEAAILELNRMKTYIENCLKKVKQMIADTGSAIDPGFKGVIGEQVRAIYRVFGEKYTYDENYLSSLEQAGFLKKNERYKVDSIKVDEIFQKTGKLPEGISTKEREKVISLIIPTTEETVPELQPIELIDSGEK